MKNDTPFALGQGEKQSAFWLKLKAHLETELANARERNDSTLDEAQTAATRGRIQQLKELIALGD